MVRFCVICISLFTLITLGSAPATAAELSDSVCTKLAEGKAYPEAANCFLRIVKSMKQSKLSKVEKKLKGLYLINAAKLIQKEASHQSSKPRLAAFYRERAAKILQQYLAQKLCSRSYRCDEIRGKLWKINKEINYAQLTVVAKDGATGKLTLQGFKYVQEWSFPPNLSQKLRPGKYKLVIVFKNKQSKVIELTLVPGKNEILSLAPPQPVAARSPTQRRVAARRPGSRNSGDTPDIPTPKLGPPGWAWVVTGAGAAVLLTGVIVLLAGNSAMATSQEKYQALLNTSRDAPDANTRMGEAKILRDQFQEAYDTGSTLLPTGWIVGGIGLAVTVGGIIGLVAIRPKPPKGATSRLQLSPQTRRVFTHLGKFSF